ncbi:hypothetical protein Dimus_028306 [Dionaea muscipula]
MGKDLSEDQVRSMREAFTLFDTDNDGRIAPPELGILMRSLGGNPTQAQLKEIISQESLTDAFDFPRFLDLMSKYLKPEPFDRQLRDAFKVLDKGGTGFVAVSDLRHILTSIGEKLEPAEFDEWIREVEVGSDGRIRYDDFIVRVMLKLVWKPELRISMLRKFGLGIECFYLKPVSWIWRSASLRLFYACAAAGRKRKVRVCSWRERRRRRRRRRQDTASMGRLHSKGKGVSGPALPYKRTSPSWLKIASQDVEENICKFAKKGLTPSQIGVILRDSHGIAQVRSVTGSKILRILKAHGNTSISYFSKFFS